MNKVILNGVDLSIEDVVNVAATVIRLRSTRTAWHISPKSATTWRVNGCAMTRPPLSASTPALASTRITRSRSKRADLHQYRTVLSHCGGVGDPAPEEVVRAAMCVRLNAFCRGVSGLRPGRR